MRTFIVTLFAGWAIGLYFLMSLKLIIFGWINWIE